MLGECIGVLHFFFPFRKGGLAIAVPGELMGMEYAWKRFGRLRWKELIQPTIHLAKQGFKVSSSLASVIESVKTQLATGKYHGLE